MRFLGFLLLVAGFAAFGQDYVDPARFGLPVGDFQPIGFTLIAIGGVLFLIGGGRRRRRREDAAAKAASKTSSIGYRQPEVRPDREEHKPPVTWGRDGDKE
ncbi:MAG: hypothetical protein WAU86_09405 [Oricola sp.]